MNIGLCEAPATSPAVANGSAMNQAAFSIKDAKGRRARERQFIQVFLSHKQKDHSAAEAVCEVIQVNSADKIKVFMAEDIREGQRMAAGNRNVSSTESDWFLLILLRCRRGRLVLVPS